MATKDSNSHSPSLTTSGTYRNYGSFGPSRTNAAIHLQHKVVQSDTLEGLAIRYNVTVEDIMRVNKLWSRASLYCKKTLSIPASEDYLSNNSKSEEVSTDQDEEVAEITVNHHHTTAKTTLAPVLTSDEKSIDSILQMADSGIRRGVKFQQMLAARHPIAQQSEGYNREVIEVEIHTHSNFLNNYSSSSKKRSKPSPSPTLQQQKKFEEVEEEMYRL